MSACCTRGFPSFLQIIRSVCDWLIVHSTHDLIIKSIKHCLDRVQGHRVGYDRQYIARSYSCKMDNIKETKKDESTIPLSSKASAFSIASLMSSSSGEGEVMINGIFYHMSLVTCLDLTYTVTGTSGPN